MINHIDPLNQFTWWSSLKHGGLLIAPARLAHYFSTGPDGIRRGDCQIAAMCGRMVSRPSPLAR